MDFILAFRVDHDHYGLAQQAYCNPTLFFVVKASIFKSEGWAAENICRIPKVESMLSDIGLAFLFIPSV